MIYIFIIFTCFLFLLFYNYHLKTGLREGFQWNECNPDDLGDLSAEIGNEICGALKTQVNQNIANAEVHNMIDGVPLGGVA